MNPACALARMFVAIVHIELLAFAPAHHGRLQGGPIYLINRAHPFCREQLFVEVDAKDFVTFVRPMIRIRKWMTAATRKRAPTANTRFVASTQENGPETGGRENSKPGNTSAAKIAAVLHRNATERVKAQRIITKE